MPLGITFTNDVLSKALDGHWSRHEAITSNLANVETPNYKRKMVHFEDQLNNAVARHRDDSEHGASNSRDMVLNKTNPYHAQVSGVVTSIHDVEPTLVVDEAHSARGDSNGVDVEVEMVTLAENTQKYAALNNLQGRMLKGVKGVLNGVQG